MSRRSGDGSTLGARVAGGIDAALEALVVPSFTRIGYAARRRLFHWPPAADHDLTGRVMVVTGATSGLGRAAATHLAGCGATLVLVGRSADRNRSVVRDMVDATGNPAITHLAADLGHLDDVRGLADAVLGEHDRLDVLIHNAGALLAERQLTPDGIETTMASHVVGPFLLTSLLLDRLAASAPSRVLTMSSGGMYSAGLVTDDLELSPDRYRGAAQYARAKRAQVTLNELWAERVGHRGIHFHALHPGWADTPGVEAALPRFGRLVGPLLRTPEQGADTLVWLATGDAAVASNGRFWLDRRPRPLHRLPATRRTDTPARRRELWQWVVARSGASAALSDDADPGPGPDRYLVPDTGEPAGDGTPATLRSVAALDNLTITTPEEDPTVVVAEGQIDSHTSPSLDEALAARSPDVPVSVDLSGVTFVDSSGLRVLVRAHKRQIDGGGSLTIVAPSEVVTRLLDITGLTSELRITP
jgi:anti-anti-sigma factor